MKLRVSRVQRKGRIEIIPMIDVMFFLLATFMLASLSMQHLDALQVNLPQGQAARMSAEKTPTLTITADNRILVDKMPVTLAQLGGVLHARIGSNGNLIIAADNHAQHGTVVQAMLAAQHAGAQHFLIAVSHE